MVERRLTAVPTPQELSADSEQVRTISTIVQQTIAPVMEAMAKLLESNNEALRQLAAAQQVQSDRLEALEKQVRLNAPVTRKQAQYLNAAIKARAQDALKEAADDAKAVRKLTGTIRKELLAHYGIAGMDEIPKCEYKVAMEYIKTWNNMRAVRDARALAKGGNAG